MKTTLQLLLLFFTSVTFSQITLEHTYTDGFVTRVKLEYSGEKYYLLKRDTNELIFYNADHSLWKTIALPATIPHSLAPTAEIVAVSENKINPDANIEIVFVYFNTVTNVKDCKIISENGNTLFTLTNISAVELSIISGLSDKLIATSTTETKVFSFPELVLENTYNYGNLRRIKLENSGEKYYLLDNVNQNTKIYNSDHSFWKTITLPKPSNAKYGSIGIISENQINTDALLEIGYSYYSIEGSTTNYIGKLINEINEELLTIPKAQIISFNTVRGLEDKLMATLYNGYTSGPQISFSTNVYGIPSLNLENIYESEVTRIKLENSGEKYFTSNRPITNQAKVYNSDHTLWKTIILPLPSNSNINNTVFVVNHISETKINSDSLLEVSYTYYPFIFLDFQTYNSSVINENGEVLLTANGINGLLLSELSDSKNKLIGNITGNINDFENKYTISKVYSLEDLKSHDFNQNPEVIISPNPAKSFININSISAPIKEATIYNLTGALVKQETAQNITKIDVENLSVGIYILNLIDFENHKSTHKITVLH